MQAKHTIKTLILACCNVFSFVLPKNRVVILLYHSVEKNDVYLTVDPEKFRQQMQYLKVKKYKV